MFHSTDGWFWERLENGDVRVSKHEPPIPEGRSVAECVVPRDIWASVVSTMSKGGETYDRWQHMREFHGAS